MSHLFVTLGMTPPNFSHFCVTFSLTSGFRTFLLAPHVTTCGDCGRGRCELPVSLRVTTKTGRLRSFLLPAKRQTVLFLQRNGCEPACGCRGRCDFAMRALLPLSKGNRRAVFVQGRFWRMCPCSGFWGPGISKIIAFFCQGSTTGIYCTGGRNICQLETALLRTPDFGPLRSQCKSKHKIHNRRHATFMAGHQY